MTLNRQLKMREQMKALIAHYQRKLAFVQDGAAKQLAQLLLDSMRSDLQQLEQEIS